MLRLAGLKPEFAVPCGGAVASQPLYCPAIGRFSDQLMQRTAFVRLT